MGTVAERRGNPLRRGARHRASHVAAAIAAALAAHSRACAGIARGARMSRCWARASCLRRAPPRRSMRHRDTASIRMKSWSGSAAPAKPRLRIDPPMAKRRRTPPSKMSDIARLAGVHTSTVSRALAGNHAGRPGSARTDPEAGARARLCHQFFGQQSAGGRRTQTISVVMPLGHEAGQTLTDPFFMEMLGHLADEITQRGYGMFLQKILPPMDGLAAAADRIAALRRNHHRRPEHRACGNRGCCGHLPANGCMGRAPRAPDLLLGGHGQHGWGADGGGTPDSHRAQAHRVSGRPFDPGDQVCALKAISHALAHAPRAAVVNASFRRI